MKGIVFTEFLDCVEDKFGLEILDELLEQTELASEGIYTTVGTYDHIEILTLVNNLGNMTNTSAEELLTAYGDYLFPKLITIGEELVRDFNDSFNLLSSLDEIIHPEVKKLYPDAELPNFNVIKHTSDELQLIYSSCRPFVFLANGLIKGCVKHFGENINISLEHQDTKNIYSSIISLKKIDA